MKNNITNVVEKKQCIGCGLCVNDPFDMKYDKEGRFIFPVNPIDDSISSYCPSMKINLNNDLRFKNKIWGKILSFTNCYSSNKNLRYSASSGGAISALLNFGIDKNIIDKALVMDFDKKKLVGKPKLVYSSLEIKNSSSSKYLPSPTLSLIRKISKVDKNFAIVAKPCEISALRGLIKNNVIFKKNKPILISFFCGGLSSLHGTKNIISVLNKNGDALKNLKYRGNGWPGFFTFTSKTGSESIPYSSSWDNFLSKEVHDRCKVCPDSIGLDADIVALDPWELQNGKIQIKEKPGKTLLISRTNLGKKLVNKAIKNKYLQESKHLFNFNSINLIQKSHLLKRKSFFGRLLAFKFFGKSSLVVNNTNFYFSFLNLILHLFTNVKSFFGACIRIFKG